MNKPKFLDNLTDLVVAQIPGSVYRAVSRMADNLRLRGDLDVLRNATKLMGGAMEVATYVFAPLTWRIGQGIGVFSLEGEALDAIAYLPSGLARYLFYKRANETTHVLQSKQKRI